MGDGEMGRGGWISDNGLKVDFGGEHAMEYTDIKVYCYTETYNVIN